MTDLQREVYEELDVTVTLDGAEDAAELQTEDDAAAALALPPWIAVMASLIARRMLQWGCEHKAEIRQVCEDWIRDKVANETLVNVALRAVDAAIVTACG